MTRFTWLYFTWLLIHHLLVWRPTELLWLLRESHDSLICDIWFILIRVIWFVMCVVWCAFSGMTVWHDMWYMIHSDMCDMIHYVCLMIHSVAWLWYVWYDSLICSCVTWFTDMCDIIHPWLTLPHFTLLLLLIHDMIYWHVYTLLLFYFTTHSWHDSLICVIRFIHSCVARLTHVSVSHRLILCLCHMTHSVPVSHGPFVVSMTHLFEYMAHSCVPWLMYSMSHGLWLMHLSVFHDSSIFGWLVFRDSFMFAWLMYLSVFHDRPTQSIMYIPFQVNIFQKGILLIVRYKYLKSCSEDLFSKFQQKSDPPHKIMRYLIYYSTQLASSFPPGRNLPRGNDLYHSCTSFEGASWRGQPLNIFTWFIGSGGSSIWVHGSFVCCMTHVFECVPWLMAHSCVPALIYLSIWYTYGHIWFKMTGCGLLGGENIHTSIYICIYIYIWAGVGERESGCVTHKRVMSHIKESCHT